MDTVRIPASEMSLLFHSRAGGFPLSLCTYTLLDADSNDTDDLDCVVVNLRSP